MSKEHLWTALGRMGADLEFNAHVHRDTAGALKAAGLELTEEEQAMLRQPPATRSLGSPSLNPFTTPEDISFQRKKMQERFSAQVDRLNNLGDFTVETLRVTITTARRSYLTVTLMNLVMFGVGIGLFVASAIHAAISANTTSSLLLAGIGAINFVTLFLSEPIRRTQGALSNLVQVQMAFMNYFEQLSIWDAYAIIPAAGSQQAPGMGGGTPSPERMREASEGLQRRTQETMQLLQRYVEEPHPAPEPPAKATP